mmetsp:Transcript_87898/g.253571  ORF Transcript_87898/g.253571 Transcript_87898/m.253571 type:complete len:114 (-) Transcript_87898:1474-1815(-)
MASPLHSFRASLMVHSSVIQLQTRKHCAFRKSSRSTETFSMVQRLRFKLIIRTLPSVISNPLAYSIGAFSLRNLLQRSSTSKVPTMLLQMDSAVYHLQFLGGSRNPAIHQMML